MTEKTTNAAERGDSAPRLINRDSRFNIIPAPHGWYYSAPPARIGGAPMSPQQYLRLHCRPVIAWRIATDFCEYAGFDFTGAPQTWPRTLLGAFPVSAHECLEDGMPLVLISPEGQVLAPGPRAFDSVGAFLDWWRANPDEAGGPAALHPGSGRPQDGADA